MWMRPPAEGRAPILLLGGCLVLMTSLSAVPCAASMWDSGSPPLVLAGPFFSLDDDVSSTVLSTCPAACVCTSDAKTAPPYSAFEDWLTTKMTNGLPVAYQVVQNPDACPTVDINVAEVGVSLWASAIGVASNLTTSVVVLEALYGGGTLPVDSNAYGVGDNYNYGTPSPLVAPEGYLFDAFAAGVSGFGTPLLNVTLWNYALGWVWAGQSASRRARLVSATKALQSTLSVMSASGMVRETPGLHGASPRDVMSVTSAGLLRVLNDSGVLTLPEGFFPVEPICAMAQQDGMVPSSVELVNGTLVPRYRFDAREAILSIGLGWTNVCRLDPCAMLTPLLTAFGVNRSHETTIWTTNYVASVAGGTADMELTTLLAMALEVLGAGSTFGPGCKANLTVLASSLGDVESALTCAMPANGTAAEMSQTAFTSLCRGGVWLTFGGTAAAVCRHRGTNLFVLPRVEPLPPPNTTTAAPHTSEPATTSSPTPTTEAPTHNTSTGAPPSTTEAPATTTSHVPETTTTTHIPTPPPPPSTTAHPSTHSVAPIVTTTTAAPSTTTGTSSGGGDHDTETAVYSLSASAGVVLLLVVGGVLVRTHRRRRSTETARLLPDSSPTHNMGFY